MRGWWLLLLLLAPTEIGCRTSESTAGPTVGLSRATDVQRLARTYVLGERIRYRMEGVQKGRDGALEYWAESEAVVRRDESGAFYEDTRWIRLQVDGEDVPLDAASGSFRQQLSLDPNYEMPFPDIRDVHPRLVGPIFDLMTFYVDLHPGLRAEPLVEEGDHTYVPHGQPNSWADGTRVILGEDAIDFSLTMDRVAKDEICLRVRHVPPPDAAIRLPAEWMREPVSDRPNNWVQVVKVVDAERTMYVAAVGSETFDVALRLEPICGRIVLATMDNPVDVIERVCNDPELVQCGEPSRYRIHRHITLDSLP